MSMNRYYKSLFAYAFHHLTTTKIDVPHLVTDLNWTSIFEWSGVAPRTDTKKTFLIDIGLRA